MPKKKSDTQFCFNVDAPGSRLELQGVALLGHQTFAELHVAISDLRHTERGDSFSFYVRGQEVDEDVRLDMLNLEADDALEYITNPASGTRREMIRVDFVDDE
jgi:hypothetical protein